MEEIKNLKMMLEGKAPMILNSRAPEMASDAVRERIAEGSSRGGEGSSRELEEELRSKEDQLRSEQEEKIILQEKLLSLERHFETKGPNKGDEKELERIRKLKEKLKSQKKREEEYIREKQRREEELLSIEKNYKSLNEEVDEMRARFKEVKTKYVANLQELNDLRNEHEDEKEELLDTIREQEMDVKKYKAILSVLMSHDQIEHVANHSEWNEDTKEWRVPNFTYKERNAGLPKITPNTCTGIYSKESQEQ